MQRGWFFVCAKLVLTVRAGQRSSPEVYVKNPSRLKIKTRPPPSLIGRLITKQPSVGSSCS